MDPWGQQWMIYIEECRVRLYLQDMIASDDKLNPVFTHNVRYAMRMDNFDSAMKWREKLLGMGCEPHITALR